MPLFRAFPSQISPLYFLGEFWESGSLECLIRYATRLLPVAKKGFRIMNTFRYGSQAARFFKLLLVFVVLLTASASKAMADYNASRDFSITNGNPNGVWGYGHSTTLGGAYLPNVYAVPLVANVVDFWSADINGSLTPHVSKNVINAIVPIGTVVLQPLQLLMHPGPNNEYSVLRFNAPCCGQYDFTAGFVGVDWIGTTTDVHILKNGVVIWSGSINL